MDSVEVIFRYLNEGNKWSFPDSIRIKGEEFCKMPLQDTLDLKYLSSSFLRLHTEDALKQWKSRSWNKNVSTKLFNEYILPYRIGDEKATIWRKAYRESIVELEESLRYITNTVDAARIISCFRHFSVLKSDENRKLSERYVKISPKDSATIEFGEFIVSSDSCGINALPISIVGNPKDIKRRRKLIDGDVLSRYLYEPKYGEVVLHIDSQEEIGGMFLLPRNDDNTVRPGDIYELLYFSNNGWKSLGCKKAEDFELDYMVPENSVLWLRDLTRGKEEQIFIIKDGEQYFNYDL